MHNKIKINRKAWIRDNKPRNINCISYFEQKAKRDFRRCHRKHADNFLQSQLDEIDRVAEVNSNPGTEMVFHGQSFNKNSKINTEWARYLRELYTPTQSDHFDSHFYDLVSQEVRHIKSELENVLEPSSYPEITTEEVKSAAKLSHCNKAGGDDGLCYEHIKYGGSYVVLCPCETVHHHCSICILTKRDEKGRDRDTIQRW